MHSISKESVWSERSQEYSTFDWQPSKLIAILLRFLTPSVGKPTARHQLQEHQLSLANSLWSSPGNSLVNSLVNYTASHLHCRFSTVDSTTRNLQAKALLYLLRKLLTLAGLSSIGRKMFIAWKVVTFIVSISRCPNVQMETFNSNALDTSNAPKTSNTLNTH